MFVCALQGSQHVRSHPNNKTHLQLTDPEIDRVQKLIPNAALDNTRRDVASSYRTMGLPRPTRPARPLLFYRFLPYNLSGVS